MLDTIAGFAESYGALGLFSLLVLCSFGLPLAKSLIIVVGGILAGTGRGNPLVLFFACGFGLHGGDFGLFLIGRKWGEDVFQTKWVRKVAPPRYVAKARALVTRHGAASIFIARITPYVRGACYLLMGSLRMAVWKFFTINLAVALVYTAIFYTMGFVIGDHPERLKTFTGAGNLAFFGAALLISALLIWHTKRSRRRKRENP